MALLLLAGFAVAAFASCFSVAGSSCLLLKLLLEALPVASVTSFGGLTADAESLRVGGWGDVTKVRTKHKKDSLVKLVVATIQQPQGDQGLNLSQGWP